MDECRRSPLKKLVIIPLVIVTALGIAASYGDVRGEIRDYRTNSCRKADLDFNGRVNLDDLRMISGDPDSGLGGFFGRATFPFWYDVDKDGVVSILDTGAVAAKNGQTC
jgi:hypothetical protein